MSIEFEGAGSGIWADGGFVFFNGFRLTDIEIAVCDRFV